MSVHMPLQTRTARAYAYKTEMGSALAFRMTNVKANTVQTTPATASVFQTRSVMALPSGRRVSYRR